MLMRGVTRVPNPESPPPSSSLSSITLCEWVTRMCRIPPIWTQHLLALPRFQIGDAYPLYLNPGHGQGLPSSNPLDLNPASPPAPPPLPPRRQPVGPSSHRLPQRHAMRIGDAHPRYANPGHGQGPPPGSSCPLDVGRCWATQRWAIVGCCDTHPRGAAAKNAA
jgi:hypothetical protein